MKYIITENTIIFYFNGITSIINNSHKYFDEVKINLQKNNESDAMYYLNKDIIDNAKELLLSTGGNLTDEELN